MDGNGRKEKFKRRMFLVALFRKLKHPRLRSASEDSANINWTKLDKVLISIALNYILVDFNRQLK